MCFLAGATRCWKGISAVSAFCFLRTLVQHLWPQPDFVKPLIQSHLWKVATIYWIPTACQGPCQAFRRSAHLGLCSLWNEWSQFHIRGKRGSQAIEWHSHDSHAGLSNWETKYDSLFHHHVKHPRTAIQHLAALPQERGCGEALLLSGAKYKLQIL